MANNLNLWLRADANANSTLWKDQSASGFNATQSTVAQQPTLNANKFNYNPTFVFDGNDDNMVLSSDLFPTTQQEVYAVGVMKQASTTVDTWGTILSMQAAPSWQGGGFGLAASVANNSSYGFWWNNWTVANNFPSSTADVKTNATIVAGAKSGLVNEYFVNGNLESSKTTTAPYNAVGDAGPSYIGGTAAQWNLTGDIAEIIVYKSKPAAAEIQRINTYLAIKYGISLAHNYVSGGGTTLFQSDGNGATEVYDQNITGIGHDDCQALHQKQSRSQNVSNVGNMVAMGLGSIATSNAANTNELDNNDWLIWGDNGLSNTATTALTISGNNSITHRMNRIWKAVETGTTGEVELDATASALTTFNGNNQLFLVVADDAAFTTNVQTVALEFDGTNYTSQYDFNGTKYFTFAGTLPPAPGCVVTDLQLWLKADAGTSTTTNNALVSSWNDFSTFGRTHTALSVANSQPKFKANAFNFNPAVTFDGSDALMTNAFATGNEAVHVFAMAKVGDAGWRAIYGFGRDATHVQWYNGGSANRPSVWLGANYYPTTPALGGATDGIASYLLPKDGTQRSINWNGGSGNITGTNNYTFSTNKMGVGSDIANDGSSLSENFLGDIAEVIVYKKGTSTTLGGGMTLAEIQRIETYLALKYGVTLSHDYFAGNGSTIWDLGNTGGFDFNITGIGHEDCSSLDQKQSKSATGTDPLVMGIKEIAETNAENTGVFTNDKAYLLWGNNNASATTTSALPTGGACAPPGLADARINRIWRVQETSVSVDKVAISVDLPFNTGAQAYMLVGTDPTMASWEQAIPMTWDGSSATASYDFAAGSTKYISFAGSTALPANICEGDKVIRWWDQGWTPGAMNKGITLGDQTFTFTLTDAGNVRYFPAAYPRIEGQYLTIPRYDNQGKLSN